MTRPRQQFSFVSSCFFALTFPLWISSTLPSSAARAADAKPPDAKPADAQQSGSPNEAPENLPKTVQFILHPAAPPAAATEFRLSPRFLERTPGNAAILYTKVTTLNAESNDKAKIEIAQKIVGWLSMPPSELPKDEVRKVLEMYRSPLELVAIAARRDHCDWDPPVREQTNVYEILLPEIQHQREVARILGLAARLQIAEGHPQEAVKTLTTGFAMARHTADCPFLVSGLVGLSISGIMLDQVEALVQLPNCPNLYWSLTALPDPLIDFRPAFELERETVFLMFPELRDVAHAQHTTAEWQSLLASFLRKWSKVGRELQGMSGVSDVGNAITEAAMAVLGYPKAKAGLIASGRDAKEVDSMSPAQAVLIYTAFTYERAFDEQYKWEVIPYWQAHETMENNGKNLVEKLKAEEVIPLAQLVIPAIFSVRNSVVRSQRRFAALRTVEALRYYAEAHSRSFPAALADIKEVPLPMDPMTGTLFEYQRLGNGKAVLEGKAPSGLPPQMFGLRYELTVAGPKK
jgi:hypothetical protein